MEDDIQYLKARILQLEKAQAEYGRGSRFHNRQSNREYYNSLNQERKGVTPVVCTPGSPCTTPTPATEH